MPAVRYNGSEVMHTMVRNIRLAAATVAAWTVCSLASSTTYTVVDLGTLGGSSSRARAINSNGDVVGDALAPGDKLRHAFLWHDGKMVDLGTLGELNSIALGVNDAGRVVGVAYSPAKKGKPAGMVQIHFRAPLKHVGPTEDELGTPFVWEQGVIRCLMPTSSYGLATAVNAAGEVTGMVAMANKGKSVMGGFRTLAGGALESNAPEDWHWMPCAINSKGDIVGQFQAVGKASAKAVAFLDGSFVDLVRPATTDLSTASGINDARQIVGWTGGPSKCVSWLWQGGAKTNLGTLGGAISIAFAINNSGVVAGASTLRSGEPRGFVYKAGAMLDLNSLIATKGWVITEAVAINDMGQIAATGTNGKESHALLLTPTE
jgi:probable HAF family extracellular repeat protein